MSPTTSTPIHRLGGIGYDAQVEIQVVIVIVVIVEALNWREHGDARPGRPLRGELRLLLLDLRPAGTAGEDCLDELLVHGILCHVCLQLCATGNGRPGEQVRLLDPAIE